GVVAELLLIVLGAHLWGGVRGHLVSRRVSKGVLRAARRSEGAHVAIRVVCEAHHATIRARELDDSPIRVVREGVTAADRVGGARQEAIAAVGQSGDSTALRHRGEATTRVILHADRRKVCELLLDWPRTIVQYHGAVSPRGRGGCERA